MPELPEVEHVRRRLSEALVGSRLTGATLHRRDILTVSPKSGSVRAALLNDALITRVDRRGKHLALIAADGRCLEIHLGMSGQVLVVPQGQELPPQLSTHIHASWRSSPGDQRVLFRDPRRFGGLWSFPSEQALHAHRWGALGPDALSITPGQLSEALARTSRALKTALLDQSILAGVGNIYADESLHQARLHPLTAANTLSTAQTDRLTSAIHQILRSAIQSGGSTLRDFLDPAGSTGSYQDHHKVYARAGQPCPTCRVPLSHMQLAQRTTTWCNRCQPPGKPGNARPRARVFPHEAHMGTSEKIVSRPKRPRVRLSGLGSLS